MERDLFKPIKSFFEEQGYVCDGEVNDIDIFMQKEEDSVAVELKQTLDFRAIQQAALRQKIVETVYIGTFMPKDRNSSSFRDKLYLLKRLGIGLIAVGKRSGTVTILSEPVVSELSVFQARNKGKKKALEKEFQKSVNGRGREFYWMVGQFVDYELKTTAADADHLLLAQGYITIVPHKIDNTNYAEKERLSHLWQF